MDRLRQLAGIWAQRLQQHTVLKPFVPLAARLVRLMDGDAQRMAICTFLIRVMGAALAYLSQILLARWMGAYEYGIYSVAWTWIIILGIFACIGFSSSPNRFIPQYRKTNSINQLRGFLRTSRLSAFAAGTGLTGLAVLIIWLASGWIGADYMGPMMLVLLALPLFALGGVQDGIARSFDWPSLAMLPTYIWRPLAIILLILILMLSGQQVTAFQAAAGAVAATWVVALYQLCALNHRLRHEIPAGPRQNETRTWLAVSMPMLLVEGFLQLITSADVIMVSFWHSPDEVAIYFAASKTLALVHFVYFAVRAASAHRFAGFIHSGDDTGLAAYVRQASIWTFWPSLAAGLGLLLIAPLLLGLFGAEFQAGYPVLAILLAGVLARASIGPADALLTMSGQQKTCAAIYAATFAVNVGLNLIFIPLLGLPGAALATGLAIVFEAVCLGIAVRRKLKVTTFVLAVQFPRKRQS